MFALIPLSLLTTVASTNEYPTLASAARAVARGEDTDAAIARIKSSGKHGLWALSDIAKQSQGKERGRLIEAMGRFGTAEAEWALLSELKASDPEARAGAIRGLAHLHHPPMYRHIVAAASSPDEPVREAVADALPELGTGTAFQLVSQMLEGKSPEAREVALRYLAAHGRGPQIEKGIEVGLTSKDPRLLYQTISLMGRSNENIYSGPLKRFAKSSDEHLALHALEVLVEIRRANAAYVLAELAAAQDTPTEVWRRAADYLRQYGDDAFPAVIEALVQARGSRRAVLLDTLTQNISDDSLARTMDLMADRSPDRAEVAEKILERLGERAERAAFKHVEIARAPVRHALVGFLRKHAKGKYTQELLARANSPRIHDRVMALELLADLGEDEALVKLSPMLTDRDPEIRATAALSMSNIQDRAVEKQLVVLAKDKSPRVRLSALRALSHWAQAGEPDAVAAVRAALQDSNDDVRCTAIGLLSVPKDPSLLGTLRLRLTEAPPHERAAIATALGGIRAPQAVVMLVDLALDKEPEVQRSAMQALESN